MAILTVGLGKQYSTITAAVAAAHDGDTVDVDAGTYTDDLPVIRSRITLAAVGGTVTLLSSKPLASGHALLTVTTDATVDGFVFSGATAADGTAVGLLDTGGALVVRDSLFTGNQYGLSAQGGGSSTVLIQSSEFAGNGNNDGFSGNVSVGAIKSLTIQSSFIHDAKGGDEVKSLAQSTTISASRIEDEGSAATSAIDLPNGGKLVVQGSTLQKGARSTAAALIRLGGGAVYAGSSFSITGSTLVSDAAGATLLQNRTITAASLSANQLFGFATIASGPAVLSANTTLPTRPPVSTAGLVAPSSLLPAAVGRAGAVVANGTVLTVGPGGAPGAYTTLAAALAAAQDGDTIDIAAGTYAIDPTTIAHQVIIEGVGGLAALTPVAPLTTSIALLTVTANVTLRNLDLSGAGVPGGLGAAILQTGGTLTIDDSTIHDNQAGIVAAANPASTLGVFDTEVARNGTPNGGGGNVAAAAIGTLTLQNDYIHDALAGPEVASAAAATVIDATRISQADGNGAQAVALSGGGSATITGGAIEKGVNAQPTPLISVAGAAAAPGNAVSIRGTTLISDQAAPTTFVAAAGAEPVTVSGATFVGGAPGSVQVQNGANTGATTQSGVMVSTAAPYGSNGTAPAAASSTQPVPPTPAPSSGVLVLRVSEDAYQGDARFDVYVDGQEVGDQLTATASHAAGLSQTITVAGQYAQGLHALTVKYLNDLQGSGPTADRNLYIDGMTFDGEDMNQSAALTANGTATLTTGLLSTPTAITVNLSETAAAGDAQALIAIDGVVQGGLQTVTTSHASGGTEAMRFLIDLPPGPHTASISFVNPAGSSTAAAGRSLFVDSIDVAGQHYAQAAAALTSNASSTFAFTVAPPAAANVNLFLTAGLPQLLTLLTPSY